jgi:hypothetical protein
MTSADALRDRRRALWRALAVTGCVVLAHLVVLSLLVMAAPHTRDEDGRIQPLSDVVIRSDVLTPARWVGALTVLAILGCAIVWIRWQADARTVRGGGPDRSEPWWWFVPVANGWFPFRTVRDLYVWSAERNDEGAHLTVPAIWQATWVIGTYAWCIGAVADLFGGVGAAESALRLFFVGDVALLVAAFFGGLVVDRVTTWLTFPATKSRHLPDAVAEA